MYNSRSIFITFTINQDHVCFFIIRIHFYLFPTCKHQFIKSLYSPWKCLACKIILASIWVMCVSKAIVRVKLIWFFFQIPEFLIVCITIYNWGTNKIFNNTRMVTGFTGFRRWLARLRLSNHILLSPVKTLFTMLVMLNTIWMSIVR
jgi:hypothetical protein